MATASKRLTRKQLREPDWFQVGLEQALEYFNEHKALVFSGVAGIVILLAAIWGWQLFKENQNVVASHEFTKALALYQNQKYNEAITAFDKVQAFRWSRYSVLAHIYLANSYLATHQLEKALSAAERSVVATKPDSLYRQIALLTQAEIEEQTKQCKVAVEHFAEAEKIPGALQSRATLGRARCAEQIGDIKTAVQAYKDYLKDNPGSPMALKLTELEAKSSGAKGAK